MAIAAATVVVGACAPLSAALPALQNQAKPTIGARKECTLSAKPSRGAKGRRAVGRGAFLQSRVAPRHVCCGSQADLRGSISFVCFWYKADKSASLSQVRFVPRAEAALLHEMIREAQVVRRSLVSGVVRSSFKDASGRKTGCAMSPTTTASLDFWFSKKPDVPVAACE
jgi:hypothetical protein